VDEAGEERPKDVHEVVNYIAAMNYGLERLRALPLSLRLIKEIHARLMQDARGAHLEPGDPPETGQLAPPRRCHPRLLLSEVMVPPLGT